MFEREACHCVPESVMFECEEMKCPPGSSFNRKTCTCEHDPERCDLKCPDFMGLKLDEDRCECVPTEECTLKACPAG